MNEYSEQDLWDKVKMFAKSAGKEVIERVLLLYYAMKKPDCPAWAKATIIGALAYFIMPADLVPDILPMIGYTDDLAVLASAIATVISLIDDDVRLKAAKRLSQIFG